jgi:hypothetical protein
MHNGLQLKNSVTTNGTVFLKFGHWSTFGEVLDFKVEEWSERQDLNLRRLGPKPSALARLSYAPIREDCHHRTISLGCKCNRERPAATGAVHRNLPKAAGCVTHSA